MTNHMNATDIYRQALQAQVHLSKVPYSSGVAAALGLLGSIKLAAEMAGADKADAPMTNEESRLQELARSDDLLDLDELINLCKWYYTLEGNECGGSLHIVLEDGNVEDSHIHWCDGWASAKGDAPGQLIAGLLERIDEDDRTVICEAL